MFLIILMALGTADAGCYGYGCGTEGFWSSWGSWSSCSSSCGLGSQVRTRSCSQGGGCSGSSQVTQHCQGYGYSCGTDISVLDILETEIDETNTTQTNTGQIKSPVFASNTTQTNTGQIKSHKFGYGQVTGACIDVTLGAWAKITGKMTMRGVSSTSVIEQALKISEHLKSDYVSAFTQEVSNKKTGSSSIWSWLGIGSNGETTHSKELVNKYKHGEKGLAKARDEYTRSFNQSLNQKIDIRIEMQAEGLTSFPTRVCVYIQFEQIKFTDSVNQNVVTNDAGTLACAENSGELGKCKDGKLRIMRHF